MSQQVSVRGSAPSRRGVSLVVIIIAILVLGGAIYGGLYLYSHRAVAPSKADRTAADAVKSYIGDLEASLQNIEKDPTMSKDEIENVSKLAGEDFDGLKKQVDDAPADVKVKVVAMITEQMTKLQPLIDKVLAIPTVKDQLEPLITKLKAGLVTLGK